MLFLCWPGLSYSLKQSQKKTVIFNNKRALPKINLVPQLAMDA